MSILYVPCTIAEALDKYSILQLKAEKITDPDRLSYVKSEMDIVYPLVKDHIAEHKVLYDQLYYINKLIWIHTDTMKELGKNYTNYSFIHHLNDMRFRVKDKINNATLSKLREQKSYAKTTLHLKLSTNDISDHDKLTEYLSNSYDEVIIHIDKSDKSLDKSYNNITVKIDDSINLSDDIKNLSFIDEYYNLYAKN